MTVAVMLRQAGYCDSSHQTPKIPVDVPASFTVRFPLVLANRPRAEVLGVTTWSRNPRTGMAPCFLSPPAQRPWRPCLPYVISQD